MQGDRQLADVQETRRKLFHVCAFCFMCVLFHVITLDRSLCLCLLEGYHNNVTRVKLTLYIILLFKKRHIIILKYYRYLETKLVILLSYLYLNSVLCCIKRILSSQMDMLYEQNSQVPDRQKNKIDYVKRQITCMNESYLNCG